ncbi:MAG: lipase secretion chaperone [Pseudomonas sp.]|uniref:lipase secretion chaperone n=1 Tax=Pseudomonas sp. TaxID=306 RepID=UPI0027326463|nr:lipase secretion chaperone [Pseudomonas sp.]MDP3847502.1 lipase secretion chaperone [Pseudomonas sp.]
MPISFSRLAAVTCCLALLAIGIGFFIPAGINPPPSLTATAEKAEQVRRINRQLSQQPAAQLTTPGALPPSLQGASHGIRLQVDGNGKLLLDPQLLQLFDFYFNAIDEEPVAKILLRIHNDLASQVQGQALAQARDLLKRYLDYRLAMFDLSKGSLEPTAAAFGQHLQGLAQLREQYFSADENQAFFSSDVSQDQFMLAQLNLNERALSLDEHRAQLAMLEAQLPPEQRAVRQQVSRDGELYEATEAMRQAGASEEEIYQLRAKTLDPQAAGELQKLDAQRRDWQARLQAYAQARNSLRQSGLSATDQQSAIADLQAASFNELERKRVSALDAEL